MKHQIISEAIVTSIQRGTFSALVDVLLEVASEPTPEPKREPELLPELPPGTLGTANDAARILCGNFDSYTHKIRCIKVLRALTGIGLKESKDLIEQYQYLSK